MAGDNVQHPAHYQCGGIETIDVIRAKLGDGFGYYCEGNAIKYLTRWRLKGGVEDLRKARVYLDWLIESFPGQGGADFACEPSGLTSKEAWWAGARAGAGLAADTPRSVVADALALNCSGSYEEEAVRHHAEEAPMPPHVAELLDRAQADDPHVGALKAEEAFGGECR